MTFTDCRSIGSSNPRPPWQAGDAGAEPFSFEESLGGAPGAGALAVSSPQACSAQIPIMRQVAQLPGLRRARVMDASAMNAGMSGPSHPHQRRHSAP